MYKEMTISELLQLETVDVTKFKKEMSYDDVKELEGNLQMLGTLDKYNITVIGKHYIKRDWRTKTYEMGRYAKYLKEYEGFNLNDINIEMNRIKAKRASFINIQFKVEPSDTIADYYNWDYSYFTGSLSGSCMRGCGERYQNIVDSLDDKEDLKIAVLLDGEGELIARSLVWQNKYFDKVYANNDALSVLLKNHLTENDYISITSSQVNEISVSISSSIQGKQVPYMDNVRYYSSSYGTLSNCDCRTEASFDDCDGYVWGNICDNCGDYCGSACIITYNGDRLCSCCSDIAIFAEDTGEYHYDDDVVHLEDVDYYVTKWSDYYKARDTGLCYKYCDYLYYDESIGDFVEDFDNLVEAYDTGNYFSNVCDIYYTVDTDRYFECSDDLYCKNGEWYENEIEDVDDVETKRSYSRLKAEIKYNIRRRELLKYIPKQTKLVKFLMDKEADKGFVKGMDMADVFSKKRMFNSDDIYDAICYSFTWNNTKEGTNYWADLNTEFNKIIRGDNE